MNNLFSLEGFVCENLLIEGRINYIKRCLKYIK
jgi:hypothetical protein